MNLIAEQEILRLKDGFIVLETKSYLLFWQTNVDHLQTLIDLY